MTNQQAPAALRLAGWLQAAVQIYPQRSEDDPGGYATEVDQVMDEAAAELRRLHAENAALQQGYDAARLEIDHLRGVTEMVAPSGEYPPLPMQFACSGVFSVYSADQMRAYVDADRAVLAKWGTPPQISESDTDYWVRNRALILQAIEDRGFRLVSSGGLFWLHGPSLQAQAGTVPLTDEQIVGVMHSIPINAAPSYHIAFARAIEQAHGIQGGQRGAE